MTNEKFELLDKIKADLIKTMKAKDTAQADPLKLSVLRQLVAEAEKEMKRTGVMRLSDTKTQEIISRQLKKLDKEIEAYRAVNRDTTKQHLEESILLYWMPQQLTTEEIDFHVTMALDLMGKRQIKNPMQYLAQTLKGQADMKEVGNAVKRIQATYEK